MAERTGGLTAWNGPDITALLPRVTNDLDDYYSLAYRATPRAKERPRDVEVRAKRKDLVVRSRRQFVEKSAEERFTDRVVSTLFLSSDETPPFDIQATLGRARVSSRNRYLVPLRVIIPAEKLTIIPEGRTHVGEFSVHVVSATILGDFTRVVSKRQPFSVPSSELSPRRGETFTYDVELLIDSTTDRVVVGVFDELSQNYGLVRVPLPPRGEMLAKGAP